MNLRSIAVIAALVPLVVAARDPSGDVVACAGSTPAFGPDLVEATGRATELGTVATWRLTFDRPIEVPSDLQIDIVVRDPELPAVDVGDETGLNRLVRWRAISADEPVEIVWLPHDGSATFNPPALDGRSLEIVVPGRLLLGESPDGTESVARARWDVVVRAGAACDRLGEGPPTLRLVGSSAPNEPLSPTQAPPLAAPASAATSNGGSTSLRWFLASLIALAALLFWALGVVRGARAQDTTSQER